MNQKVSLEELNERLKEFCIRMDKQYPTWDTAILINKVNQYYFTGTMQDGFIFISKEGILNYFVRRSYDRAINESPLSNIFPVESYRDALKTVGAECGNTFFETETMPIAFLDRFKKYFNFISIGSLDRAILSLRSVKSEYEIYWTKQSGLKHSQLLLNEVPFLLREGMSEADLIGEIFTKMMSLDYQGISRFSMFQAEMIVGQIGFGESSLYPTSFDGPGGSYGMYPASPVAGSRERKLKYGDLVFVDIAFAINGYHTDKTQVYQFGGTLPEVAIESHKQCREVMNRLSEQLKPEVIPADLYNSVYSKLDESFTQDFMGFGKRQVRFFGHGVGLNVDEYPVIANGFKEPLMNNMVIALEPKRGIAGVGMVGAEETFIVTPDGGQCVTGGSREIILL